MSRKAIIAPRIESTACITVITKLISWAVSVSTSKLMLELLLAVVQFEHVGADVVGANVGA